MKSIFVIFSIVLIIINILSVNGEGSDTKSKGSSEAIGKQRIFSSLFQTSTISPGNVNPGDDTSTQASAFPIIGTLGTLATVLAPKGAIVSVFTGLKFFLISLLVTVLMIAFLATGTAYFTCSIVDCSSIRNNVGSGDLGSGLFSRNTYEYEQAQQPIYQGIDNGHAKYGSSHHSPSYPTSFSGSSHYKTN